MIQLVLWALPLRLRSQAKFPFLRFLKSVIMSPLFSEMLQSKRSIGQGEEI